MEERGERLKIFDVNHEKAPTLAQIALQLSDDKGSSKAAADVVDWIANGIKAENDQYVFDAVFSSILSSTEHLNSAERGLYAKLKGYLKIQLRGNS